MGIFIVALVLTFGVLLAIGALTGRVKTTHCCSAADPMNDLRMRPYLIADEQFAETAPREART